MQDWHEALHHSHYRLLFITGCFGLACCELAGAVAHGHRLAPAQKIEYATANAAASSCLVEMYAYLKVRGLAEELGRDGDLLDDALNDLRTDLADCLNRGKPSGESEMFNHTDPSPERPHFVATTRQSPAKEADAMPGPEAWMRL